MFLQNLLHQTSSLAIRKMKLILCQLTLFCAFIVNAKPYETEGQRGIGVKEGKLMLSLYAT